MAYNKSKRKPQLPRSPRFDNAPMDAEVYQRVTGYGPFSGLRLTAPVRSTPKLATPGPAHEAAYRKRLRRKG